MTTLDQAGGTRRIRVDAAQLADELAKLLPDRDQVDLAKAREAAGTALHDAADRARQSLDRATERARDLRDDIAQAGDRVQADNPLDDVVQRIRALVATTAIPAIVARLERDLPDTDRDRYERAYTRGRVQARSIYLTVGIAAGITAGVAATLLLDPRHGKERRERIAKGVGDVTCRVSAEASARVKDVRERASAMKAGRGRASTGPGGIEPASDASVGSGVPEGAVAAADPAPGASPEPVEAAMVATAEQGAAPATPDPGADEPTTAATQQA